MAQLRQQRDRLQFLAAKNRQLSAEAWIKVHVLDGLLSTRKEIRHTRRPLLTLAEVGIPLTERGRLRLRQQPQPAVLGNEGQLPLAVRSPSETPTLLIVEDDPNDFLLLKRALWRVGASSRVWWAREATEALQLLTELETHVGRLCVVADLQLPGFSGFELLERIRARGGSTRIRFAFLTGRYDRATEERAYACGADAFFVKCGQTAEMAEVARALQRLASQ